MFELRKIFKKLGAYIHSSFKTFSGFTLVELLMVIALLAIAMGVSNDILISIMRSYAKSSVINEIEQEANFVSLLLEHDLRNALNVSSNGTGTLLTISLADGSTIIYEVTNNTIYRYPSGASASSDYSLIANPSALSRTDIIGGVNVVCSPTCFEVSTGSPQTVGIHMSFEQASSTGGRSFSGTIPLETLVVIRNTY